MTETVVRLVSLKLVNIKNVACGTIVMPGESEKDLTVGGAKILGIYGQKLDPEFADYIDIDSNNAEIVAEFKIFGNDIVYEVGYHIWLSRNDKDLFIVRESLTCAKNEHGTRTNKNVFMDYQREDRDAIFKPQKRLDELVSSDKEIKMDLIVARKMAEKSNCSYIFGESSREIFCKPYDNDFKNYAKVITSLFQFALKDLFVIRNSHSGMITANFLLPMAFRIENTDMGMKGDFVVPLTEPIVLDNRRKTLLDLIVDQINTVLYTIIPGLTIEIKDYGKQSLDSGEEGVKVELMSKRTDKPAIPIRMESEGIIKIISILNILIQAFGNPSICLAIDAFDSGIFEYMLGELLDIFHKSAKGQLIFTSHNLRALEMLDKHSIMFSTVNPSNRYIHMKNIRETNNLRNMYIRCITLGGQDEIIYEETDSLKIARAFRKAGRDIRNA